MSEADNTKLIAETEGATGRQTLKAEALKRANVLNASAAWGSDWDAHLLTSLVRYVEELETSRPQVKG